MLLAPGPHAGNRWSGRISKRENSGSGVSEVDRYQEVGSWDHPAPLSAWQARPEPVTLIHRLTVKCKANKGWLGRLR